MITVGVDFAVPMILTVRNQDTGRPTFLDVARPGGAGQRVVIEAGDTFSCRLKPGPADLTFGDKAEATYTPDE